MTFSGPWWIPALVGLVGGIFSGLVGVGGGFVMIPLMTGILRFRQHDAHGTSLFIIIPTATAAGIGYAIRGEIRWDIVAALAATAIVFAALGARLTQHINAVALRRMFAVLLVATAVRMFIALDGAAITHPQGAMLIVSALVAGVVTGLISGTMGVGGGIVMVPAMVLFMAIDQRVAQGISLAVIIPTAVSGAIQHYRLGHIRVRLGLLIMIGAVAGAAIGAELAHWLPEAALRVVFGIVAIYAAQRMFGIQSWVMRRLRPANATQ